MITHRDGVLDLNEFPAAGGNNLWDIEEPSLPNVGRIRSGLAPRYGADHLRRPPRQ